MKYVLLSVLNLGSRRWDSPNSWQPKGQTNPTAVAPKPLLTDHVLDGGHVLLPNPTRHGLDKNWVNFTAPEDVREDALGNVANLLMFLGDAL